MYKFLLLFPILMWAQNSETETLNQLLNHWHHAAAIADEETFFDATMSEDAVYIGTDATELWTRDEMKKWAQIYFDRDTAWDFTVQSRNIYFSRNKKTAWFDELLDTWMGTCRSSGVLEKRKGKWQLVHYQLSIAVPNEVVQEYLKLIHKK